MTKRYVSKHRKLMIGKEIKFLDGYFETDDPKLQEIIEQNSAFGIAIHFQEDPAIEAERKARAEAREKLEAEAQTEARERDPATGKNRDLTFFEDAKRATGSPGR